MKQFQKLTLAFSALLVVAFSFCFTKTSEANSSFQSKSIEFQLATLAADDVDDDFGDQEFENICEGFVHLTACVESVRIKNRVRLFDPHHTTIPFYLQIKNLRI